MDPETVINPPTISAMPVGRPYRHARQVKSKRSKINEKLRRFRFS
jgi:predicted transcriptional regulator